MKVVKRWKFLRKGMKSENGEHRWRKGKWYKFDGALVMCEAGFHCSKKPHDAFSFVQGEILAEVECRGKHLSDENKECWQEMRVVKCYRWTKKDSLKLAIFSAELVLKNFEREFPRDKRPREAIEAAKKVLEKDTKKNREAAWESAWESAWSVAESAELAKAAKAKARAAKAAKAARAAAWSARAAEAARSAESAESAAWSARAAAAAELAIFKKIINYFGTLVKDLEEI